ncbi:MAG: hypothetical protein ABJ275_03065 [Maricaulaceae bacterium]
MPMKITQFARTCSVAMILSLSACATVDVTSMGSAEQETVNVETVDTGNIITRTVKRLHQAFVNKGWSEDVSQEKTQSAANVLLNGLEDIDPTDVAPRELTYTNADDLLSDIKTARYHLSQTTKAAEVYLDVASSDSDLSGELKQLQKALHDSETAHENFIKQKKYSTAIEHEIMYYASEVEKLRAVTNDFGDIVRARRLAVMAASAS